MYEKDMKKRSEYHVRRIQNHLRYIVYYIN
jgi:hypothetical protein